MLEKIFSFLLLPLSFPGMDWRLVIIAVLLGFAFGVFWLIAYWPPLRCRPWLWLVGIASALLTWLAIGFIQVPLQVLAGQILHYFWDEQTLVKWLLLAGIPQILLSGLVQEGSKLLPVLIIWWRHKNTFSPITGLIAGAVAGAAFGIFEAVWVHNTILYFGWTWSAVEAQGFTALLGFWERFFTVGFHTAVSALAGYGLAKGMGWQFFLIASGIHAAANYSVMLLNAGVFDAIGAEIYISLMAVLATVVALWLRWGKNRAVVSN